MCMRIYIRVDTRLRLHVFMADVTKMVDELRNDIIMNLVLCALRRRNPLLPQILSIRFATFPFFPSFLSSLIDEAQI